MIHLKSAPIFLLSFTILFAASCSDKNAPTQQGPPAAVPVTVETVENTNASYFDEYPGSVAALNEVKLTSQVSGYVTGIFFADGSRVHKGQKLYTIDAQIYDANYQQAVANLQVQEANLEKAQKDDDRYHELDKHDAIAKQQVDYADAALQAAQKQVAASKANVAALESNVRFSTIYAPFDGTIGISQVKKGTLVVPGQTVLNTVSSDNPIAVDFPVDQKNIYRFLKMEESHGIELKDSTFTLSFSGAVYPYPGQIAFVDRAVDPQTGTIKTRLIFKNTQDLLRPGMNTTVRVMNEAPKGSTVITYDAVSELLGEFFVYKVDDSNRVHQQKVQLGKQIGNKIIVTEGLNEGDRIVVQGVQNLHEGSLIALKPNGNAAPAK
ncbi:MAG: efflux RND transporter periplasmic adaptor subunit [Bacteroidota bacterium]|nr:efflux RND transporter periplasmic adaptor subunit [Bacteroidota bacterium]